jgi:ribokinase
MKILNFGSLNIDHVYGVEEFVRPGETIAALSCKTYPGGKGLNQSIALARAGAQVYHAGRIGTDGMFLKALLESDGVNCNYLAIDRENPTGHAMIQVSRAGENCIVLFGGTNQLITAEQAQQTLAHFEAGDVLLLQNEISAMQAIMKIAAERGMRIYLNPAPMNDNARALPLELVDTLVVNETEGASLAGIDNCDDANAILTALHKKYPKCNLLLTLGARGSCRLDAATGDYVEVAACHVDNVVDTTAAGDTFIGYYLAGVAENMAPGDAMKRASRASAICVSRAGAGVSIPLKSEV